MPEAVVVNVFWHYKRISLIFGDLNVGSMNFRVTTLLAVVSAAAGRHDRQISEKIGMLNLAV